MTRMIPSTRGAGHFSRLILRSLLPAMMLATSVPALAQTPGLVTQLNSLPPALDSLPLQRFRYFYDQRAFPYDQIPAGAYQQAIAQHEAQFGPLRTQTAPLIFNQSLWTLIGPSHISTSPTTSGRTNTIAIDPTNTSVIYVGAATGGVWKTTNGGTSWTPLTDTQCSVAMGSIAIDPSNHLIVYAGTGEENFSADSYSGCGILKSTDGGTTWTQLGASIFAPSGAAGATIGKIAIHPTITSTLLVASNFGLYRSTDSGSTYSQVLSGTATDVVIDPVNPNTMYAALGNIFGSGSNGVYMSTNAGATWAPLGGGLPTSNVGRIGLAVAASASGTVYATVQNVSTFALLGIWKTTNFGSTWTQLSANGVSCAVQCWYDMYVAVDPTNANTVYFGGLSIYKSTDGGSNFSDIGSSIHVDQHALTFQPGNANTLVVGNDGGVFMSTNGGSTWSSLNTNLAITQFYPGLSLNPASTSRLLGGTQDNDVLIYGGNIVWDSANLGCDGGFTAIDFVTPTTGYGECQWSQNSSFSGPQRTTNIDVNPFVLVTTGINNADPARFIPPIVMSPSNSQTLYFGTNKVYKTTNQGTNWTASGTTLGGNLVMIAEAPSNSSIIYATATNGLVYKSTDSNASYASVSAGLPARVPTYVAIHPTDPNTAFVTVSGFGTGHVWKTTNGGTSWSDISGNLPNIPANAVLLDPTAPTTEIMVGTDLGVYRSHNGGTSWVTFNTGLPNVPVLDLKYNAGAGIVYAATHGRGVWKATNFGQVVATHDFNGDAKSDIAFRDTSGNAAIWLMSGTAVLNPNSSFVANVAGQWSIVGQRDFNGDGKADLLWHDTGGNVAIWEMNGTTVLNASTSFVANVPTPQWSIVGTGDFNGDTMGDLLWQDMSGNVAIWEMNGTTILNENSSFVANVASQWSIKGTGDFNGDGKADILWQDTPATWRSGR